MAASRAKKRGARKGARAQGLPAWPRRWGGRLALGVLLLVALTLGNLFAHQPARVRAGFGRLEPLLETLGLVTADATDALGLTGRDAEVDYALPPPDAKRGPTPFGAPKRKDGSTLAPNDVQLLVRKGYCVGYSPSLGHPVWAAYALPREKRLEAAPPRPPFMQDAEVPNSPPPEVYTGSGYDRGHMAPNSAIATRYGLEAQRETFLMTNIAPQRPDLNRGPWRELEQLVAKDLSALDERIWVIVCTVPDSRKSKQKLPRGRVRIPEGFAMIVASVHQGKLRAIGAYMPQTIDKNKAPRYCLRSIRELEERTGLDFFSLLPADAQERLETPEPTRFWPKWRLL